MFARPLRAVAALAVVAAVATGCSGSPAPAPSTPTPLTDEQAFAAAEQTYRAYVDALNQVDLSDPATFEPVYALTTGDLNESDRESFSRWHAEGNTLQGSAVVAELDHGQVVLAETSISATLYVCFDVTEVEVLAADGSSLIDESRPNIQPLLVTVLGAGVPDHVASIEASEDSAC